MEKDIITKALDFIKETFENEFSGHDYFHSERVYKTALNIAKEENANETIVALAAILHDVDDRKLSIETYENKDRARKFLKENNVESQMIEQIILAIKEVSFEGTESKKPSTIEGMCVQDADRLDAIGAIGIARAFSYGGNHNRKMYDPNEPPLLNMTKEQYHNHKSHTVNHFYEKLFLLKDMFNTAYGKQLAGQRDEFMHEFIDQFLDEWQGKK